ncbi:MAG: hypothetical protein JXR63_02905 [Spirochaetales bacterium]|nr:hypothetical protein [Spirochaetales bacterium]
MKKKIFGAVIFIIFSFSCKGPIGLGSEVDISLPSVSIGNYATGGVISNGDYVKGSIILTGSFDDDTEVAKVELSLNEGVTFSEATLDAEAKTWSFAINTALYVDGEKNITVKVTDKAGKSREEQRFLIFDNTKPVVVVSYAAGYEGSVGNYEVTVRGEAVDPFRIKRVFGEVVSGSASFSTFTGLYSWNASITTSGTGIYSIKIYAEDFAGNISDVLFYYNELVTANSNSAITTDSVYTIYNGGAVSGATITYANLVSLKKTFLPLTVDLSLDEPNITVINPEDGDKLGPGSLIVGRVIDDDGVNLDSVTLSFNGGDFEWDSVPVGNTKDLDDKTVSFFYEIPDSVNSGDDNYFQVKANDIYGLPKISDPVTFSFDAGAPTLTLTSHDSGDIINSYTVTFAGEASDDSGITAVKYSLDNGATWTAGTFTSGSSGDLSIEWETEIIFDEDRSYNIKFRAEDDNSSFSIYNLFVEIDTEAPEYTIESPSKGLYVNSTVTFRGSFTDKNTITSGYILVGTETGTNTWQELSNLNYWSYSIDSRMYDNATLAEQLSPDSTVWKLDVRVKATDIAGNQVISDEDYYFVYIDNSLDSPTVFILNPSDGVSVGGPLRVAGTSFDDDRVYKVYVSLDYGAYGSVDWYEAEGTNPWSVEINTSGELYSVAEGHEGLVTIRVRAQDSKDGGSTGDIYGDVVEVDVQFDDTLPFIGDITPAISEYVKDTFYLDAIFYDKISAEPDINEGIQRVEISFNNGASYVDITSHANVTRSATAEYDRYIMDDYPIDTTDPGLTILNGVLYLRLKVIDNAGYQNIETLTYLVDNTFPSGAITSDLTDAYGSAFVVQGTSEDLGTVAGVKRVEVYVSDVAESLFYSLRTTDSLSTTGLSLDLGSGGGEVLYPTGNAAYIASIDDFSENGNDASGDGDGFDESITLAELTYNWFFKFDSNLLDDGQYKIHYIVFDVAENGKYYSDTIFVKNSKPVIDSVQIGIDLNNDGDSADVGELSLYNPGSLVTARYNYLKLTINDSSGNGDKLYYFIKDSVQLNVDTSSNVLEVLDTSGYTEGENTITCRVVDDVGIIVELDVKVVIDNVDDNYPVGRFIQFYDREKDGEYLYYNGTAWGYTHTESDSFVPVGKFESTVFGHYESSDYVVYGGRPSLSGDIYIYGYAHDDQLINNIYIGYDKDKNGTIDADEKILVASGSASGLLASEDEDLFVIDTRVNRTQTLTDAGGHSLYWTFKFDTSLVDGASGEDIGLELFVEDLSGKFNGDDPSPDPADIYSVDVNVYPYILSVVNEATGLSSDVLRSAQGYYSINLDASDNLIVTGFNFHSSATAYLSDTAISATGDGTALTTTYVSKTQVKVSKDISTSGYLTIFNGSIPSINNLNGSDDMNLEKETGVIISEIWEDDRYLHLWELTELLPSTTNQTFYYPDMVMAGDTPIFAYCNDNNGYTYRTTGLDSTSALIGRWFERSTAIAKNSSNTYYIVSVEDAFAGGSSGFLQLNYNDKSGGARIDNAYAGQSGVIELIGVDYSSRQLNRFKYPKIIASGSDAATQVYITVYDAHPSLKSLRFFSFKTDGDTSDNLTEPTIDSDVASNGNFVIPDTDGGKSSQHYAMTLLGGSIYVAYYDESDTTLKIKYSSDHTSSELANAASSWDTIEVDTTPLNGRYVSMTDDGTDLYLAYYDGANSDLKFAKVKLSDSSVQIFTIDAYLSIGTWTNIQFIGGLPYIAYYADSYNGTNKSVRIAYPTAVGNILTHGVAESGASQAYSGNWEIITVPTLSNPRGGIEQFNKVQLGTNTSSNPVVGWLGDSLEVGELKQ